MDKLIKPGKYIHFKGFVCDVFGVARHSETQEELVVYSHDGQLWTRPAAMFLETVEKDGKTMPRFTYQGAEKLVRDQIPDIIKAENRTVSVRIATEDEYRQMLKQKIREEADEFAKQPSAEELADILEVAAAAGDAFGISNEELERVMMKKRQERGGFEKRFILKRE